MSDVTLPSGLSGEIREISVGEENDLSDPRLARNGRNVAKLFSSCWLNTLEPAIYQFADGVLDPDQLLQGDSLALLVNLRIETHGAMYEFDVKCPECKSRIPWEVDLKEFLEINSKKLPEESAEIIRNKGGVFEAVFPKCERAYKFKLIRGSDERTFPAIRRRDAKRLASKLIDISLLEVDGIRYKRSFLKMEPYPKDTPEEERLTMGSGDANFFRRHSDEVNCGLETSFEIVCVDCGEVKVELPFLESFLMPILDKA